MYHNLGYPLSTLIVSYDTLRENQTLFKMW